MAPRKPAAAVPARLPAGLQLTDVSRLQWQLDTPLGAGGHGAIYAASAQSAAAPASPAGYVIKVEPHDSGPLFTEMHCYHRVGRPDTIAEWQRRRRRQRLGMPRLMGSGSLVHAGQRYRFMVLQRFGSDLQRLLDKHGHKFPLATVLHIGLQVLDVLEYLHDQEYIHGDVKGQNLLLGLEPGTENQVYLVDYGLACRYANDGRHKSSKPDPKKAHNGTIEFTSRDAHLGAPSRRGDLEVLGYNLLQWSCGRLPWQSCLSSAEAVASKKRAAMEDVPALVRGCFPAGLPPGADAVQNFLSAVAALPFETAPDYDALRAILRSGLATLGSPPPVLRFTIDKVAAPVRERSPLAPLQPQDEEGPGRRRRRAAAAARSPPPPALEQRGRRKQPAASKKQPAASQEQPAATQKQSAAAQQSPGASIYDNMTPSMRAVLDRRAAGVPAPKAAAAGVPAPKAAAAAVPAPKARRGRAVKRRAADQPADSDSDSDAQERFYTPPSGGPTARPPLRRHRRPLATALSPRRRR